METKSNKQISDRKLDGKNYQQQQQQGQTVCDHQRVDRSQVRVPVMPCLVALDSKECGNNVFMASANLRRVQVGLTGFAKTETLSTPRHPEVLRWLAGAGRRGEGSRQVSLVTNQEYFCYKL